MFYFPCLHSEIQIEIVGVPFEKKFTFIGWAVRYLLIHYSLHHVVLNYILSWIFKCHQSDLIHKSKALRGPV